MLTFVTGCMSSGKTEALVRSVNECVKRELPYVIIAPESSRRRTKDSKRYGELNVKYLDYTDGVSGYNLDDHSFVFIDEVNLLEEISGLALIKRLVAQSRLEVFAYGLRRDRHDKPYNSLTQWLLNYADTIDVLDARCAVPGCHKHGYNSILKNDDGLTKNVIDDGNYQVYCKKHWLIANMEARLQWALDDGAIDMSVPK